MRLDQQAQLEEQVRQADRRRWTLMLDEERQNRVTVRCECGVRLDRVGFVAGRFVINNWKAGRERDLRDETAGRKSGARALRNPDARQQNPKPGEAVNYRCGKCDRHYAKTLPRLEAAARRRLQAGGRELVLGVDL